MLSLPRLRPIRRALVSVPCAALMASAATGLAAQAQTRTPNQMAIRAPVPEPAPPPAQRTRPGALVSTLTFADLGFHDGFRFANLGGRREIFVELPQGL